MKQCMFVIPPMFEGLYLRSSSIDFQAMGLIWKLIAWLLNYRHFMKLSRTVTENSVDRESKSCSSKASWDSHFAVTEQLSFTKSWQIKDQSICLRMSPSSFGFQESGHGKVSRWHQSDWRRWRWRSRHQRKETIITEKATLQERLKISLRFVHLNLRRKWNVGWNWSGLPSTFLDLVFLK